MVPASTIPQCVSAEPQIYTTDSAGDELCPLPGENECQPNLHNNTETSSISLIDQFLQAWDRLLRSEPFYAVRWMGYSKIGVMSRTAWRWVIRLCTHQEKPTTRDFEIISLSGTQSCQVDISNMATLTSEPEIWKSLPTVQPAPHPSSYFTCS
jgi:hypothetical protein